MHMRIDKGCQLLVLAALLIVSGCGVGQMQVVMPTRNRMMVAENSAAPTLGHEGLSCYPCPFV
jgi:hypothetical protein